MHNEGENDRMDRGNRHLTSLGGETNKNSGRENEEQNGSVDNDDPVHNNDYGINIAHIFLLYNLLNNRATVFLNYF